MLAFRILRQEDSQFEASLNYTVNPGQPRLHRKTLTNKNKENNNNNLPQH